MQEKKRKEASVSMIHLKVPVIVEGKYDKARLAQVVSAPIVTTEGFGIFRNQEKTALIRRMAADGVVLLCDSDGGGKVIRGYLKGILPPEKVYDLYVPQVAGKEKRKHRASKAGFLGVEGIDNGVLTALFEKLVQVHPELVGAEKGEDRRPMTKADLYFMGLTGGEDAGEKRDRLCLHLGFPCGMTPTAFLTAMNLLYTKEDLEALCRELGWE